MKKWLTDGFLPMWAKQTVLQENRRLTGENQQLQQQIRQLQAYISGLEKGLRRSRGGQSQ